MGQSKFIASQNKMMMKPLKRYSIAVKEWVELYKVLGLSERLLTDPEGQAHLQKHAISFVHEYEESVNEVLPMINTYADNLRESMEEIGRYSEGLEVLNENFNIQTSPPEKRSPQQFDYKELNFPNPLCSPESNNEDSISRIGFSSVLNTENQDATPNKDYDFFRDPQLNLFQTLQDADKLDLDQEKSKEQKSSK